MKKVCSGCNNEFECLGNDSCWCNKLELSKIQLKILHKKNKDCFCDTCLKKINYKCIKSKN